MITIEPHAEGAVLSVRAQPGARANGVRGEQDGALKLSVTTVAEKGKANKALTALLARLLQLRKSQLVLLSGATSAQKRYLVIGLSVEQLRRQVDALLEQAR